ncbi:hypothetical protein H5410_057483 [Solanum commersonii]|uniref:Uncharacterized protein n=1 Tax=Solanum commersonii TaxID=4109 RepID=A0A9J5WPV1_SOLCO|nr:hypothetical protein H5410_057483 [Solanum commersonii]
MDTNDRPTRGNKRSKSTTRPLKLTFPEDEVSILRGENDTHSEQSNQDYTKPTVQKLKKELTKYNLGAELLQLKEYKQE